MPRDKRPKRDPKAKVLNHLRVLVSPEQYASEQKKLAALKAAEQPTTEDK